jgi:vacuolar-type H+-ATPase subunit I/STV1
MEALAEKIAKAEAKIAEAETEVQRLKGNEPSDNVEEMRWQRSQVTAAQQDLRQLREYLNKLQDEKLALINQQQGN